MLKRSWQKVCITPRLSGVGGMVSFQHELKKGLMRRGVSVTQDLSNLDYQAVLVIGGTRNLVGLWRARKRGIPVIQRLNGMNWLHRVRQPGKKLPTGWRHFIRSEYGNRILSFIRQHIASSIIYQSRFACDWWERVYGKLHTSSRIIYNGVDLEKFFPKDCVDPPVDRFRVLMVEGSLMGGYEHGLKAGLEMTQQLSGLLSFKDHKTVELAVVGKVDASTRADCEQQAINSGANVGINWIGLVARGKIPSYDRAAHVLYSSDINAACPNSVIEALACGLPVVSFDTGALPELVTSGAGRIVSYGGDPWRLDPPDIPALARGAFEILHEQDRFRKGARERAEEAFGVEIMLDSYLEILLEQ